MAESTGGEPSATGREGWPTWAEALVSLLVLVHLAAVLIGAFAVPPMSTLEGVLAGLFRTYYGLVDTGYPYHFFAPEPPPTSILIATLRFRDGSKKTIRIPDRRHGPRLAHQRYMALANTLYVDYEAANRTFDVDRADRWARSYARHLCLAHKDRGCVAVTISMQMHLIPELERAREILAPTGSPGLDRDDEEFFTGPELIGEYQCDDF